MPFTGELMMCVVCSKRMLSTPQNSPDWRMIEVDGHSCYACPAEFPKDGATKEEFKIAYQVALACCLNDALKQDGKPPIQEVENYRTAIVKLRGKEAEGKRRAIQNFRAKDS